MSKYKVGGVVLVDGTARGVVTEVPVLAPEYLALPGREQFYSVRLDAWVTEPFVDRLGNRGLRYRHPDTPAGDGAVYRDHEADCLGCVNESRLTRAR